MATYLDRIVAHHRQRVAAVGPAELAELAARAVGATLEVRDFEAALLRPEGTRALELRVGEPAPGEPAKVPAVIAEIKRRSPSKGVLASGLDPARVARSYAAAGAACLSVLTDAPHFAGSPEDLIAARAAADVPVLRKDFTVGTADLYEARLMGADAVLLIVAVLGRDELGEYLGLARSLGLSALVEVHDEPELARALEAGATLVGVNQRDLHSFAVDTARACRVAGAIPPGVIAVAESGIRDAADLEALGRAGFDAVLVGEALVTAEDPGAALAALRAGSAAAALGAGQDR